MAQVFVLTVENLSYSYTDTLSPALDNINLEITPGSFNLLLGPSGSGKSTLLRVLAGLAPAYYGGNCRGRVLINGKDIRSLQRRELISRIGMIFQDPETQLVMTGVEQEIAFGLENMGMENRLMKRRVVEMAASLGISPYLQSFIPELSGGMKQKVALASILAMQPDILLLDEPASQLDPVSAEELFGIVRRLNEEQGLTILMVEQRLERCLQMADRIIIMDQGKIVQDDGVGEFKTGSFSHTLPLLLLPPIPRVFAGEGFQDIPFTVKEGRRILRENTDGSCQTREPDRSAIAAAEQRDEVYVNNLSYTYPGGHEALKKIDMSIKPGEFLAIIGENGAGKTTFLKILAGLLKPGRGSISIRGGEVLFASVEERAPFVGYLSQEPGDYLFMPSVEKEVSLTLHNLGRQDEGTVAELLSALNIERFRDENPRDLSAGERQRVALAAVLAGRPGLLLLDEPTRGLDYMHKDNLGRQLSAIKERGVTIIMATHDIDFAAEVADSIALMSAGTIIASGDKYEMLQNASYYSSQTSRLFAGIRENIVTIEEGRRLLREIKASLRPDQAVAEK